MAAMKSRTGDDPLETTKKGRGIIMRILSEGGGRLVIELTPSEVSELASALSAAVRNLSFIYCEADAPTVKSSGRPLLLSGCSLAEEANAS